MALQDFLRIGFAGIAAVVTLWAYPCVADSLDLTRSLPVSSEATLSDARIQEISEHITVKIIGTESEGSGVILEKQQQTYKIITNAHVIRPGAYKIQTVDGKVYPATIVYNSRSQTGSNVRDVALLQFTSPLAYETARLGKTSTLNIGDRVYASGFPFDTKTSNSRGWRFTSGQVLMKSRQTLEGGYQVAYNNNTEKGMSGGAVLNSTGELIALHGQGQALIDINFKYLDNTTPCESMQKFIGNSSWGIPVEAISALVFPHTANQLSSFNPNQPAPEELLVNTLWLEIQAEDANRCQSSLAK